MGRREKPLDPGAGAVQRFAHELRKLRDEAGTPTYRDMARRAGYSAPTLAAAAAGERLPSAAVLAAYVSACGGDPGPWAERLREAAAEIAGARVAEDADDGPYPGLARFEPGDGAHFHGRDDLTAELLALTGRARFAAAVGASGSGKSSLLRAGLIPALRALELSEEQAFLLVDVLFPMAVNGIQAIRTFLDHYRLCHVEAARMWLRASEETSHADDAPRPAFGTI